MSLLYVHSDFMMIDIVKGKMRTLTFYFNLHIQMWYTVSDTLQWQLFIICLTYNLVKSCLALASFQIV